MHKASQNSTSYFNKDVFCSSFGEQQRLGLSLFPHDDETCFFSPHKCKFRVSKFSFDIPVMNNISKEWIVHVHHVILMRKTNMLKVELYHCGSVYMTINHLESFFFIRAQFIIIHVRCCG